MQPLSLLAQSNTYHCAFNKLTIFVEIMCEYSFTFIHYIYTPPPRGIKWIIHLFARMEDTSNLFIANYVIAPRFLDNFSRKKYVMSSNLYPLKIIFLEKI